MEININQTKMQVRFKKLTATAKMPTRAHATDAGLDLYVDEKEHLKGLQMRYISNIAVEIPKGYVGLLFPRPGVFRTYQHMTNCVGVIYSGYRGSINAVFFCQRDGMYYKGDRFAQLIIMPYPDIELVEADELTATDRGEGGYGSTGK